jgi:hypothetical protein
MTVEIKWVDEDKTAICYVAMGDWNWNEFHKKVKISTFQLDRLEHDVDTVLDLTGSVRLPAGAVGHLRMLGKVDHPRRRPRAIIIGADAALQQQMGAQDGVYATEGQLIHFVKDAQAARDLLFLWQA